MVLLVLAVGIAPWSAVAQEWPTLYLYVNDLTSPGALLSSEVDSLDSLCYEIDSLTTAEVAILLVNTTLPYGIDLYAVQTFEANAVGKQGLDNGVLIVVSVDEGQWRVEVGYGLEGILPDSKVGTIGIETLTPALQVGDYYNGLFDATLLIGQEIVDNYSGPGGDPQLIVIDWWQVALGVAVVVGVGILTKGRVFLWIGHIFRRGGFGGGRSGGGGARGRF